MRKVFADSSILIAGAASRTGASRAVLTMAEIGLFKLVVSEQVLAECQTALYFAAHTVQSSVAKPKTLLKSPILRVNSTKSCESAIAAIRKSIVAMRTRRARNLSKIAAAPASNGKTGAAENP